jgi:8-oxo-dGTP pyrophosphatase MutT (NUDIX family)
VKSLSQNQIETLLKDSIKAGNRKQISLKGFHTAGVLVPIILNAKGPELLFTKRTEQVETHKGQVSFPGGMADQQDGDIIHTALREAWEEVGIPAVAVRVVGILDDLPTPTGFVITPIVGIIEELPVLVTNVAEVAEVFHVPLSFFAAPSAGRSEQREFKGKQHEVWFYEYDAHTIWGVTAVIVRLLLKKLDLL